MNVNDELISDVEGRVGSYPSIYAIGHAALGELFDGPVLIEEKIDGSQFSFSINAKGEVRCRSKGAQLYTDASGACTQGMFQKGADTVMALRDELRTGWVYRGEYLQKPKHNTINYSRVPKQHVIIFDIETGPQQFLSADEKFQEADRLGLECVPTLYEGEISSAAALLDLMRSESCLGGAAPEGLVVKNYARFGRDKKVLMGKYVTEAFKEKHANGWRVANPTKTDVIQGIIATYRTEARWEKAVQHLRDAGQLEGSPKDIGLLIKEVPQDILKEEEQEIRDIIFNHVWPQVKRGLTAGLPEWYKQRLMQSAFEEGK